MTAGQSLLAVAGYHIFNGDGTGTDIVTVSLNGVSVENNVGDHPDRSEYDIRYTVNPDCAGTYTVPAAGLSFDLFIAPDGEELVVIGTDPALYWCRVRIGECHASRKAQVRSGGRLKRNAVGRKPLQETRCLAERTAVESHHYLQIDI